MTCQNCNSTNEAQAAECYKCGFPFTGTERDKSAFIAQQIMKAGEIDDAKSSIKSAKIILFFIGIVNIVLSLFTVTDVFTLAFTALVGLAFIIFGLLVEKNPFLFLLLALIFLTLLYLAAAINDAGSLIHGVFWKIGFMTSLVYGMIRVKRAEKLKKESQYLNEKGEGI